MRNRDFNDYKQGTQNIEKLLIVEFVGWQVTKQSKTRIQYNPHQVKSQIEKHLLEPGTELICWYKLLGKEQYSYNKFPVSPDKKQGQDIDGKLYIQITQYYNVTEMKSGHYYALWHKNTDERTHGTDKPGYWYITDALEASSEWGAHQILQFKKRLVLIGGNPIQDIDFPHPKKLITYIDTLGSIDGPALYNFTEQKFGEDHNKPYNEIMALIDYVRETEVISPRVQRFLKVLDDRGLLQKYLTNS